MPREGRRVPDGLSSLQRHCLAALEVDVYVLRPVATVASAPQPAPIVTPPRTDPPPPTGPLLLLAADSDRAAALTQALARVLGATLHPMDAPRPAGAVLVSLGDAAPDAALTLPPLASLRSDARLKQRSWLKIRSFLRLRRSARA